MEEVLAEITTLLKQDQPVYHDFQNQKGVLVVEKLLPYLCVYRYTDEPQEEMLEIIRTQAAYLIGRHDLDHRSIINSISQLVCEKLGSFMVVELWPGNGNSKTFKLFCRADLVPATANSLREQLKQVATPTIKTRTKVIQGQIGYPKGSSPLYHGDELQLSHVVLLGLEIPPVYREKKTGRSFPIYFRGFKSLLSEAIKRAAFEFIRVQTSRRFSHHLMFGKTVIDNTVKQVDQDLANISNKLKFLLSISPINQELAWEQFKQAKFKIQPKLIYRTVTLDPEQELRTLYNTPIDKVEDPALAFIFRDKRRELAKKLDMIDERDTDNFKYTGQSIFGTPSSTLVNTAKQILKTSAKSNQDDEDRLDCNHFAEKVYEELKYYRDHFPEQDFKVTISKEISGLMVSQNQLFIGESTTIPWNRVDALIQHEVGTHILTYCNGLAQPLSLMATGFAGYDQLQEGLAVFSEYLVGGLTIKRLHLLAARVLAVDSMINGMAFHYTFNKLVEECELSPRQAFKVTVRVYRGGGLTKDAIYLQGLIDLLKWLQQFTQPELLYTGKFAQRHIPLIQELLQRNVLQPPIMPNYYYSHSFQDRLKTANKVESPLDLVTLDN